MRRQIHSVEVIASTMYHDNVPFLLALHVLAKLTLDL